MAVHLDTDFLVFSLIAAGPQRRRLREISASGQAIEISAIAWYEFSVRRAFVALDASD